MLRMQRFQEALRHELRGYALPGVDPVTVSRGATAWEVWNAFHAGPEPRTSLLGAAPGDTPFQGLCALPLNALRQAGATWQSWLSLTA